MAAIGGVIETAPPADMSGSTGQPPEALVPAVSDVPPLQPALLEPTLHPEIPEGEVAVPIPMPLPTDPALMASQEQPKLEHVRPTEDDVDENPIKRQRLDTQELAPDPGLDDEAVLALAAHGGPDGPDSYPSEYAPTPPTFSRTRLIVKQL